MKKMPDWLKNILLIIISFISLYKISKFEDLISSQAGGGFNINSILFNNISYLKSFFVLGSISSFFMIFYYILNIFLVIRFSQNKNPVEVQKRLSYLPQFIQDWVKPIEKMSKHEDNGYFIEFYLRLIIVYLLIFLMCVIILIKLVSV